MRVRQHSLTLDLGLYCWNIGVNSPHWKWFPATFHLFPVTVGDGQSEAGISHQAGLMLVHSPLVGKGLVWLGSSSLQGAS